MAAVMAPFICIMIMILHVPPIGVVAQVAQVVRARH
jgi:hypothetical protein